MSSQNQNSTTTNSTAAAAAAANSAAARSTPRPRNAYPLAAAAAGVGGESLAIEISPGTQSDGAATTGSTTTSSGSRSIVRARTGSQRTTTQRNRRRVTAVRRTTTPPPTATLNSYGTHTDEVNKILKNVVANSSQGHYNNQNVTFVLWIYSHPTHKTLLLSQVFLPLIQQADLDDRLEGNVGKRKCKMRSLTKEWIENCTNKENCPILLDRLTFDIFSCYLVSRKKPASSGMKRKRNQGSDGANANA